MKSKYIGALVITTLLLAGCNQQKAANSDNSSVAQMPPTKELCTILKGEDVSALVGYTVTASTEGTTVGGCNYKSSDATKGYDITVAVHLENTPEVAAQNFESELDFQNRAIDPKMAKIVDVQGIGNKADLITTSFSGNLLVHSKTVWISVSGAGSDENIRNENLKKVAAKVLSVL